MITSSSNQQIRRIQQLQKTSKTRQRQRVFVVEGPRMVLEAPEEWLEKIYVSESFLLSAREKSRGEGPKEAGQEKDRWQRLWDCGYEEVSDSVFQAISDTRTPQGILAVVRMPRYTLADLLSPRKKCILYTDTEQPGQNTKAAPPLLLVLDTVQDPGNLGTMLRTGEGAGISGILMNRTTADIFSPKVIRSTMGSIFRVPFVITEDLPGDIQKLRQQGIRFYAAHLKGKESYNAVDYSGGCGFLIGNEGNGLSQEIASLADTYVRIPMAGQVESLNAAMAAGLLMYEAALFEP